MITAYGNTALKTYEKYLMVQGLDREMKKKIRESFESYVQQEVIKYCKFDDQCWHLTDEIHQVRLSFDCSKTLFNQFTRPWMACSYACYIETVKSYIVLMMGRNSLSSLQEILRKACKLGNFSLREVLESEPDNYHLAEILKLLPDSSEKRDLAIEHLEEYTLKMSKSNNQRQLLDFSAYFRFHDKLEDFWKKGLDKQKLYYFPLYFWWNLTTILPLRVTEFLLIPRDCLKISEKGYLLTIRRTTLKGPDRKISYKIQDDYQNYTYTIPERMAEQIQWYISKTQEMRPSPCGSLFRSDAVLPFTPRGSYIYPTPAYSYSDLSRSLHRFCNWKFRKESDGLSIHLGDTRHIAMMNLIISGGSPSICMELAGHSDIDISSHYYSNMSSLVECATYEWYRKKKKGDLVDIRGEKNFKKVKPIPADAVRIKDGWCTSEYWKCQNISDCIHAVNSNGELGDCFCCKYYWPDRSGIFLDFYDIHQGKESVDADTWFLIHMIENVRKGLGAEEDIKSAILRLQNSAFHYRECLIRKWEE